MKNKRNLVAIIVIVAVLVGLAITAFFLTGRKKSAAPAALTPIEGDAGNLADDEWTARY